MENRKVIVFEDISNDLLSMLECLSTTRVFNSEYEAIVYEEVKSTLDTSSKEYTEEFMLDCVYAVHADDPFVELTESIGQIIDGVRLDQTEEV